MKFSCLFVVLALSTLRAVSCSQGIITEEELKEKSAQGFRLLRLSEASKPVWKTEGETFELLKQHAKFFDVTEVYRPEQEVRLMAKKAPAANIYTKPSHQSEVKPLLATASLSEMQGYLSTLTAFNNRYYKASTGQQASVYIRDTIADIIKANPKSGASVALFNHTWIQSSIVAKIPGKTVTTPVTILGAHMDSINLSSRTSGRAPGADDDGSGTVNLMEAFRVLVSNGFTPSTPVEFHWYSGEEPGLLGSQAIAQSYNDKAVKIKAMLQLDMTAYVKPGTKPVAGLMPDYTNSNLTSFVGSIIDTYTGLKWVINDPCGYACSDHSSWDQYGYPTALPFEGLFNDDNPKIHSSGDTIDVAGFNWTHSFEFSKLAVAYAYELAI